MPYLTARIAQSIGSSILFRNLFLTIFMLLNKRSTSAFKLGRINRLIANVAKSLNRFPPDRPHERGCSLCAAPGPVKVWGARENESSKL